MSGVGYPTRKEPGRPPPRQTFAAQLWEFVGYPDDETIERRRILYAIVALRLGFGLFFLLRGGVVVFGSAPAAFAVRLGNPASLGLGTVATDTILFIVGCSEIGIGLLLIAGAFTRVSAVVGTVLLAVALAIGQFDLPLRCLAACEDALLAGLFRQETARNALLLLICGLFPIVLSGSPFLGADRAIDKLEEEERDRAPAVLPQEAWIIPPLLRLGLALTLGWYALAHWQAGGLVALLLALLFLIGLGLRVVVVLLLLGWAGLLLLVFQRIPGIEWLAVLGIAGALLCTGAGRWSVDALIAKRLHRAI